MTIPYKRAKQLLPYVRVVNYLKKEIIIHKSSEIGSHILYSLERGKIGFPPDHSYIQNQRSNN